jgi:hypothetical protein
MFLYKEIYKFGAREMLLKIKAFFSLEACLIHFNLTTEA